jgi:hypothetical protein
MFDGIHNIYIYVVYTTHILLLRLCEVIYANKYVQYTLERGRCGTAAETTVTAAACAIIFLYFCASGRARERAYYFIYYIIIVNSGDGRAASAVLRGTFNSRPAAN